MIRVFGTKVMDCTVLPGGATPIGAFWSKDALGFGDKKGMTMEVGRVTGELADRVVVSGFYGASALRQTLGFSIAQPTS